jgi:hypothetical protein
MSGDLTYNTCPMAELVTASDCYLRSSGKSSEGREFEPHWGSSFCIVLIRLDSNSSLILPLVKTASSHVHITADVLVSQHCIARCIGTGCTGIRKVESDINTYTRYKRNWQ